MFKKLALFSFFVMISLIAHASDEVEEYAAEILNDKGKKIGQALFRQGTEGILIRVNVKELTPGVHGMHFHNSSSCKEESTISKVQNELKVEKKHNDQKASSSTKEAHGYFNPEGPEAADLPNLIVSKDGSAHAEFYTNFVSIAGQAWKPELMDEDGSALIISENEDDHFTQPNGNSGKKVACAAIILKKSTIAEPSATATVTD